MKKLIAIILALVMALSMVACAGNNDAPAADAPAADVPATDAPTDAPVEEETEAPTEEATEAPEVTVMTHAEYVAAAVDAPVVVEFYVQDTQGWWFDDEVGHGKITVYGQDNDGGYFGYELACEEEVGNLLVPGTKVRATGYRAEWSGEIEIMDGSVEIIEGADTYIAEALDVTELLGTDELVAHQNEFVSFKGMTVAPSTDAEGNEVAFLYNWDGSGSQGNDLYFNVTLGENTYNFCVESYLRGADSDVYKAVEALEIGQVVDLEGFLYWYEGVNPHITSVTVVE